MYELLFWRYLDEIYLNHHEVYEALVEKEEVEGFGAVLGEKILLKRFGQASEVAKTISFLASDDSSFITGTEIVVDGGLTVNTVL